MLQQIQFNQKLAGSRNTTPLGQTKSRVSFTAVERTLLGIKPDAFEKNLAGTIGKEIIDKTGLKIIAGKVGVQSRKTMETHYAEHQGKGFFDNLINYVTRGKFGAYVLEGDDAVSKLRAAASEVRAKYAPDSKSENLVHSSDSTESAAREIGNFFSKLA